MLDVEPVGPPAPVNPAPVKAVSPVSPPTAPLLVLSDATAVHVVLQYPRGDSRAEARARQAASMLRASGMNVADPLPVSRPAFRSGIGYFFQQDRDGAEDVARALSGIVGRSAIEELPLRSGPPPPGSVEVLLAGR